MNPFIHTTYGFLIYGNCGMKIKVVAHCNSVKLDARTMILFHFNLSYNGKVNKHDLIIDSTYIIICFHISLIYFVLINLRTKNSAQFFNK